jgi:hypothetical protein
MGKVTLLHFGFNATGLLLYFIREEQATVQDHA